MKSALKSASHKKISNGRQPTKSEIYFEVKPYTQNVIFSDNILQDNFDSSISLKPFKFC